MLDFDSADIAAYYDQHEVSIRARHAELQKFEKSGYALIKLIPRYASVLDVGCGHNLFKQHFPNLVGIDIAGNRCDHQVSILNFRPKEKFDAILCLGSVLGSLNDIKCQIGHITSLLHGRGKIYWRNHPACPQWGTFPAWVYPWSEQTHHELSKEFGYTINELCREYQGPFSHDNEYRIYAEWTLNQQAHTHS